MKAAELAFASRLRSKRVMQGMKGLYNDRPKSVNHSLGLCSNLHAEASLCSVCWRLLSTRLLSGSGLIRAAPRICDDVLRDGGPSFP